MKVGRRKRTWILVAFAFASFRLPASVLWAASDSGAAFLKIPVGARAAGMGSVYAAAGDDVNALHWNPAGLTRLRRPQFSASHAEWLADLKHEAAGFAVPTRGGAFGVGVTTLWQEGLERRDGTGAAQGRFAAYDAAATLSLARRLSPRFGAGASVKYVRQVVDDETASGFAADAGVQWKLHRSLTLGAALQNAGPRLKFAREEYRLPLTASAGFALTPSRGLCLAGDVRRVVPEERTEANLGTEYWAFGKVALRAGYQASWADRFGASSAADSIPLGVGFGLGLRLGATQLDYAAAPNGALGASHRVSVAFGF